MPDIDHKRLLDRVVRLEEDRDRLAIAVREIEVALAEMRQGRAPLADGGWTVPPDAGATAPRGHRGGLAEERNMTLHIEKLEDCPNGCNALFWAYDAQHCSGCGYDALKPHDCVEATQEFRLQNDREWKAKVDFQRRRAEMAIDGLRRIRDHTHPPTVVGVGRPAWLAKNCLAEIETLDPEPALPEPPDADSAVATEPRAE